MTAASKDRDIVSGLAALAVKAPDDFCFPWQRPGRSDEVVVTRPRGKMSGAPVNNIRDRIVFDAFLYTNPRAVVESATFDDIKPGNFADVHSEYQMLYGDEALRQAHVYLKAHPEPRNFQKQWQNKHFAYITIITDDKYLPGVILLHYSIRMSRGEHPFVVLYTSNLSKAAITVLELVQDNNDNFDIDLYCVDPLMPAPHHTINVADPRFADTWTKLRVFQFYGKYTTMVYLDADMLVTHFDSIDRVFDYAKNLPRYCIAAVHDCTCSDKEYLGKIPHVRKENCVLHYLPPAHLEQTLIAQPGHEGPITMFNSGMFVFHPNRKLWKAMKYFFDNTTQLGDFLFPDQDFLVAFFKSRWASIPLDWNAVKTMVYRHENLFIPNYLYEKLTIIHYIVDKPWMKYTDMGDEVVGFSGRDRDSHAYWWSRFRNFREQRERRSEFELRDLVDKFVADREGKRPIDEDLNGTEMPTADRKAEHVVEKQ